ncbi:MAG: PAS domain-containing protein [Gammaproteobacteria bacterium]|nr:PAS domain-containing protein [Gammaproteobacteria bacterium]
MSFFRTQKIQIYLLLFFALVTTTVIVTIVHRSAEESAKQLTQATGAELESLADEITRMLDREMHERMVDIELAAKDGVLTENRYSAQQKRDYLDRLKRSINHYAWLGLVDLQGNILVGSDGLLEGKNVSARTWFKSGLNGLFAGDLHAAVLLEPYLTGRQGDLPLRLVDVSAPVFNASGEKIAVLGAHIDWRLAHNAIAGLSNVTTQRQVEILVLTKENVVVSGSREMMLKPLEMPLLAEIQRGQRGFAVVTWPNQQRYLTAYTMTRGYEKFQGLDWKVLVRQPVEVAFAPVKNLQNNLLRVGLLLGVIFMGLALWLAKWLALPLVNITRAADDAMDSEQTAGLPSSARYTEVEKLSTSLNKLLGKLIERQQALEEARAGLEIKVEERTEELRQSEKMLWYVMDTIPARVFWKSPQGVYLGCNALFARDAGFELAQEVIGKTDFDMPWFAQAELYRRDDQAVRESRQALMMYEEPQTTLAGKMIWLETSKIPITNSEDEVIGTLGVYQDITERKQAQLALAEAHKRLEAQNAELVYTAQLREDVDRITRHDLKNPLNAIIGVPSLLIHEGNLDDEQVNMLKMVQNAGYRMLEMINTSLDIYKMEVGKYVLRPTEVDLNQVFANISNDLATLIQLKEIRLTWPNDAQECIVVGETLLCHTLFSNLIKNAIEAAPSGSTITVSATTAADDWCRIAVHNPGAVPEPVRERFFTKYATFGKTAGTGLGAYSAKLLTETQGGRIAMETSEQNGTTITVMLRQGNP